MYDQGSATVPTCILVGVNNFMFLYKFTLLNALCLIFRSDSPGHCAKYGSYTFIDADLNKVLDIEVVQVSVIEECRYIYKVNIYIQG